MRHKEGLLGLPQGGDIAMSVCPAGRRPHGYLGKYVWNGGCLSDLEAGPGRDPGSGPESWGLVFGMDAEQRGGAQSWPGTTWGSKETYLGPHPPAVPAGHTTGFWPPDIQNWVGDLAPPLSHAAGSDPGLATFWLCDMRQVQLLPEPQFPQL